MAHRHPPDPEPPKSKESNRETALWVLNLTSALVNLTSALLKLLVAAHGEAPTSMLMRAFATLTKILI